MLKRLAFILFFVLPAGTSAFSQTIFQREANNPLLNQDIGRGGLLEPGGSRTFFDPLGNLPSVDRHNDNFIITIPPLDPHPPGGGGQLHNRSSGLCLLCYRQPRAMGCAEILKSCVPSLNKDILNN